MAGSCFTSAYDGLSNVLKNEVAIKSSLNKADKNVTLEWTALWDTGATCSVITKDVVTKLGLVPVSMCTASTPQGTYNAPVYYIDLMLPNGVVIPQLRVMEGQPLGCHILIGMDVIIRGDFAVSHHNNKTVFSFRVPSMARIDFVSHSFLEPKMSEKIVSRNSPCPCGKKRPDGKPMKYKNCCGKT